MKRSIYDYTAKFTLLNKLTIIILVFSVILSLPALCESHDESENPSFKYSRQANENFNLKKAAKEHHHHHEHDGNHDHGHHDHHDHHHDHYGLHEHDDVDDEDYLKNLKPDQAPYEGLVPDPGDDDHHHRIFHADHSHDTHHPHHHKKQHSKPILDMQSVWLNSIGSTLLISAAPFLLLYVIPLDNSEAMKPRLKVLLAFASGGLLGDAFLHLIPHATHPHSHHGNDHHDHDHDHHHHHDTPIFIHQIDDPSEHPDNIHAHEHGHGHSHGHDMTIGLWVLGGIIAFLSVEKLVRLLKGSNGNGHGHSHGHGHAAIHKPKPPKKTNKKTDETSKSENAKKSPKAKNSSKNKKDIKAAVDETSTTDDENAEKKSATKKEKKDEVEISGYLNLAADFAHNFTDGLAIGASYLAGNGIGIVTTLTILLHEVPHEIGDFAILIKSGCSRRKAMLLQLVTALGAVAGTALALLGVSGDNEAAPWVLPFTAGGFIYIATVSVLPELLEESTKFYQSIKEIIALLTGVGLMVLIANYE